MLAVDTWLTNRETQQQLVRADESPTDNRSEISEKPVSDQQKQNHVVAADKPRILRIPNLKVETRILQVGITPGGKVDAPKTLDDTAWYEGSVLPGTPGVSFIDGHHGGITRPGIFSQLQRLQTGDPITIERGDGTTLRYTVTHIEEEDAARINMRTLLIPSDAQSERLILMTCTGTWEQDKNTYRGRTIVTAERTP